MPLVNHSPISEDLKALEGRSRVPEVSSFQNLLENWSSSLIIGIPHIHHHMSLILRLEIVESHTSASQPSHTQAFLQQVDHLFSHSCLLKRSQPRMKLSTWHQTQQRSGFQGGQNLIPGFSGGPKMLI